MLSTLACADHTRPLRAFQSLLDKLHTRMPTHSATIKYFVPQVRSSKSFIVVSISQSIPVFGFVLHCSGLDCASDELLNFQMGSFVWTLPTEISDRQSFPSRPHCQTITTVEARVVAPVLEVSLG